ncbi:MAG: GNAT family N-acetyltransferase [Saprospiraceae bacterium]|uniref:GNAT family N-acetyltransferase n=1 Tax=Candidatus Opimibacter skivensis TaxID=2982028 RepID=A0A9D7SWP1_9BACT|nr:GNAT family N-acetyltransferase [Candidatus Opimibacter skivensis]
MDYYIETERLILRHLKVSDAAFIVELLNSKGWLEYIGDRNVRTIEQAETYLLNGPIKSYAENGYGLSLVSLKEGNIPIGACGLLKRDYLDTADLGFAFLPEYIGKGYGYESASAVLSFAKHELNISPVLAFTVPNNVASIGLLEKLGFRFEKVFTMPGEEEELLLFSNSE